MVNELSLNSKRRDVPKTISAGEACKSFLKFVRKLEELAATADEAHDMRPSVMVSYYRPVTPPPPSDPVTQELATFLMIRVPNVLVCYSRLNVIVSIEER